MSFRAEVEKHFEKIVFSVALRKSIPLATTTALKSPSLKLLNPLRAVLFICYPVTSLLLTLFLHFYCLPCVIYQISHSSTVDSLNPSSPFHCKILFQSGPYM